MRHVCSAAAAVALTLCVSPDVYAQGSLSITNYRLVSEERYTRTESYFTYRADLVNTGPAREALTATVSSKTPNVKVVPGQTNLHFSPVPSNSQVPSIDSFTILVDRAVPFDFSQIQWSFVAPVANAGRNQTAPLGSTVSLNGTASANPSGIGQLTYRWSINYRPPASKNEIANSTSAIASFVLDAPGTYVMKLVVSNGAGEDVATTSISTVNSAPVANAGPNQTVPAGSLVTLNGSGSSDVDGDQLSYSWQLISIPSGSGAMLAAANTVSPTFIADKPGTYIAQLIVSDGVRSSTPATVNVATANTPPVANAGPTQTVSTGSLVQLNGSGSTDVDRDPLTYQWTLITKPSGSTAVLSSTTAVNPTFTADKMGTYVAQLIVNDGKVSSAPSTVTITTNAMQAPTANAGPDQSVKRGATVTLNGSGTDSQNLPLTYTWSLTTKPAGSTAVLAGVNTARPTFVADIRGVYVAQLIVNNGNLNSAPDTVTINTENTRPIANAGQNQSVLVGNTVTLNGSASSDPDNDPITYNWSISSKPEQSTATLTGANTGTPTFLADVAGVYVVQLIVSDGISSSDPVTVTIAASGMLVNLTPNPLNLTNSPGFMTVTLLPPPAEGGVLVRFTVADTNVAIAPAEITIPVGASGANFQITPKNNGSTNITASAAGYRPATAAIVVSVPSITLTLAAPVVGLSRTITGTVTLSGAAPPGGATVAVSAAPAGKVTVQPNTVNIPAGSSTGTFEITGVAQGSATITASANGYTSGSANISVQLLGAISVQSGVSVGPGQTAPLQISLVNPAPAGGVTVALSSSDLSKVTIAPATITIPEGATTPATHPNVTGVGFGTGTITASASGFTSASQAVQVTGVLAFSPASVIVGAGGTHNLNLTLSSPAPAGGLAVNLLSSNTAFATVPSSITIPQNQTSVTVPLTAVAAGQVTITASTNVVNVSPGTLSATVVVFGGITLPAPAIVDLGQTVPFPITLSQPAPAGGVTVTLAVNDSTKATITPLSVTVPVGATVPAQQPQVKGLAPGITSVTATATGYGSSTGSVQVRAALSFASPNITVSAGFVQNIELNLSGPAPAGGLAISLQSNNTALVTVPSSVTIPPNVTKVNVPLTGVAPGTTLVRASSPSIPEAAVSVTVQANGAITVPANLAVVPGQSVPFTVALPTNAPPGGVTVSLTSSDASKVTVLPASVTISAGQTAPATQPQVTGVAFGSATITAASQNYASGTGTVKVGAALSFPPATVNLLQGATQNVTLTLSVTAPAGGLPVTLTSSAIAQAPSSVTIPAGATSVSVPIQGLSAGSTTITASSAVPNISSATLNVVVQNLGTIGGPASVSVPLGQSTPLAITLPAQAPAGGLAVSLTATDPAIAAVLPASLTIPAGQTQPSQSIQISGLKPGTTTVRASANGYGPLVVAVQVTASLSFDPATLSVNTNETKNLILKLSGPAPAGGIPITLASANTAIATVPPTITFPAGAISANVPVTGVAVGSTSVSASGPQLAQVTAAITVSTGVDIIIPQNLTVAPGEWVQFPVALGRPAASVIRVNLVVSDLTKAKLSYTAVFIDEGQTQPTASPRLEGIAPGEITITASSNGLNSAVSNVKVGYAISFAQSSVQIPKGTTQQVGLSLSGPAPVGGVQVALATDNTAVATVPANATFSNGATSINVPVTGAGVGTTVIRASGAGLTPITLNVTVVEPSSIALTANSPLHLNSTAPLTITLSKPAPAGGVDISLSSSNTDVLSVSPAIVTIPGGQTTPAKAPEITGVNVGNATITASSPGYLTGTRQMQVNATIAFAQPNVTLGEGTSKMLSLSLSTGAPLGGITINLSSTNTNVVTTQALTYFYWDGSDPSIVIFPIKGVAPGTAQIKASGINIPEATVNITVTGPVAIGATSLPNGNVNVPYVDGGGLMASGGTEPYSFTLISGTLPANLTLNPATGRITGTPTSAVNATPLTFRVIDSSSPQQTATKSLTLTVVQQQAASIAATSGSPQSAKINTAFGARLVATVKDSNNQPVPNVVVTFAAPSSGASATFTGGNTATTDASGVATSNPVSANNIAGSYTVSATVANVATSATFSLTNTAGDPASIAATGGTPQSTKINTAFAARLSATVKDAGGNTVSGVAVTFALPSSGPGGTFAGSNVVTTNSSGVALSPVLTANGNVGTFSVSASVAGVAAAATFSLTVEAGNAASIASTSGTSQSAVINTTFANPLVATVRDSGGNPLQGILVTFNGPASGAGVTFPNGNTATTNASGVVSMAVRANATAGAGYAVSATVAGVATPAQFTLTNTAGAVATLTVTDGSSQSAAINTAFGEPLVVTARDAGGNAVSGATVTFAAPGSGASGSFAGGANTAVTNSSGVATSAVFTANSTVGSYSVTASSNGKTAVFSLANIAGAPASMTPVAGTTPQSATILQTFAKALAVTVRDSGGNPIADVDVTFTAPASGASGTFAGSATARTNASGVATAPAFTANGTRGSYTVQASAAGRTADFAMTNTQGAAHSVTATGGGSQSTVVGTAFANRLLVTVKDQGGNLLQGVTVTFSAPSSGASASFTGGNTAATDASGVATSPALTANTTAGSYQVVAAVSGLAATASFDLTNLSGAPASIAASPGTTPQDTQVNTTFGVTLTAVVKDTHGNTVPNKTVTFRAPQTTASGTFTGGVLTATATTNNQGIATAPVFKANTKAGSYVVTAETAGVAQTANYSLTNTAGPAAAVIATSGGGQTTAVGTAFTNPLMATVTDAFQNPLRNVAVTFTAPASGASANFDGQSVVLTNPAGVATSPSLTANATAGSYAVTASVSGVPAPASFPLTNAPPQLSQLILGSTTVGKGLQAPIQVAIPAAVAGPVSVTITSTNPAKVLLTGRSASAGQGSITVPIDAGQTSVVIYAQALDSTSTVNLTAEATDYATATSTITLAPSGFVLAGPGGIGSTSFSIPQDSTATVTIYAARLTTAGAYVETQAVRGSGNVDVTLSTAPSGVGTLQPSTAIILAGESSTTSTFRGIATGATTISASNPNFLQGTLTASVTPPSLSIPAVTVGKNLQTTARIQLAGVATGSGLSVTITSGDAAKMRLSKTATDAGTSQIIVLIPTGANKTPDFYIQGLSDTGTVSLTASASVGSASGTVTLAPAGFILSGPFGPGVPFALTTGAPNAEISVVSALLDSARAVVDYQPLRAGLSVSVPVASSNTAVGTITISPVPIAGNAGLTFFDPISSGSTVISLTTPDGFTTPAQNTSLTVNVSSAAISVSPQSPVIGKNLQQQISVLLGQQAPAGGLKVTLSTSSPSLLFGLSASDTGTNPLVIDVPAGGFNAAVYLNALAESGTVSYTISAPGYVSKTDSVTLAPSGVVVSGPFGFNWPLTTTLAQGKQSVIVQVGVLDAATKIWMGLPQPVRGGLSLTVPLSNSTPAIGTVPPQIVIPAGSFEEYGDFTPLAVGQTTISVTQPSGLATPSQYTTLVAKVN